MKNKNIVITILVVSLLVALATWLLVYQRGGINIFSDNQEPENKVTETTLKTFARLSDATVTCEKEENNTIPTNEIVFNIQFADDVPQEYVENVFDVAKIDGSDDVEYTVVKQTQKYYQLKVVNELDSGAIYNVVETTTDGTKKWAFQTEQKLEITYTYPDNGSFLRYNSGFEISFNNPLEDGYEEYFSITPSISGYWANSYSNEYTFRHPNENFVDNNKYTVTIKSGLKDIYGNELKEDYKTSFIIKNSDEVHNAITNIQIDSENVFDLDEKLSFIVYVFADADKDGIDINQNEFMIYDAGSVDKYIEILRNIDLDDSYAKSFYDNNECKLVLKQKATSKTKIEDKTYYDVFQIDTDFKSSVAGYYVAVLRINNEYQIHTFQINNNLASINFLSTKEAIVIYKNAENKNNAVDVFVNNSKIGKTKTDGSLYIENTEKVVKDFDKDFNYLKIDCDTPLIFDVTGSLGYSRSSWNDIYYDDGDYRDVYVSNYDLDTQIITRHNNGYIYNDRPVYKVGETVNLWGYAKNRVYGVKEAKLNIYNDDDLIETTRLTLDKQGCFKYQFVLDDVNSGSYVRAELEINGEDTFNRYINILDYSKSSYSVDVEKEGYDFLEGESTVVKITATTYDGVPLPDTVFKAITNESSYDVHVDAEDITIGKDGVGYGNVTFGIRANDINPTYPDIRYDNSILDGDSKYISYRVYPYKNYYQMKKMQYNKKDNTYTLSFEEYKSKDHNVPANDSITVEAFSKYEVRTVRETYYDTYYKEERKRYDYNQYFNPDHHKTFTVEMVDGKGSITIPNWSDGKNEMGYYSFRTHINTDDGRTISGWSDDNTVYEVYGWNRYSDEDGYYSYNSFIDNEGKSLITKKDSTPTYHVDIKDRFVNYGQKVDIPLVNSKVIDNWEGTYTENEQEVEEDVYKNLETFLFIVSGKGAELKHITHEPISFVYEEGYGANIQVYPIIYDGTKIYSPNFYDNVFGGFSDPGYAKQERFSNKFVLKTEDLNLDIKVSYDKEKYKPGEEATIKVKTTHNGKGVRSGVNLSAIDSAYIDENGSSDVSILDSLVNPYNFDAKEISSHMFIPIDTNDGGGGGGDGGPERTNILTTAFFENVITDSNGDGEIKIKLPDNITEWTITTQGISEDYRAGSNISKVIVTKDYYVALTHKDKYVKDEKFAFNVKSYGSKYIGKDTTLSVAILDSNNKVIESGDIASKVGVVQSYKLNNGLKVGKYKIKLSSTLEGLSDTLIEEIEVRDNLLEILSRETLDLNANDEIDVISPNSRIYVLNKDVEKNINLLFELMTLRGYGMRNDSTIISDAAYNLYAKLKTGKNSISNIHYRGKDAILKLMNNSSYDAELALRNFATGVVKQDRDSFNTILNQKGKYAKMWAQAACGEPILRNLKEVYNEIVTGEAASFTREEVLYVALGLTELGDYDDALVLYNNLKPAITENDEKQYILLTTLAIKLNLDDRIEYYNNLLSKNMMPEVINYIKLYYLQNEINRNTSEGKLVLYVDNQTDYIKINNIGYTEYKVDNKHKYVVKDLSDNIKVMLEDYKPIDTSLYESKGIIKKTYSNNNPKEGDVVTVTITVDRNALLKEDDYGLYTIQDVIPNNMAYIETTNTINSWYCRKDGQKIEFHVYASTYDYNKTDPVMTYQVRVTNSGEQKESGTVLTNFDNEIIDIIKN